MAGQGATGAPASPSGEPDELPVAGSAKHLWFILEPPKPQTGYVLCHHATDLEGMVFKTQMPLSQKPVAMAAWDNRVWLTFAPKPKVPEGGRETFTVEVQFNPAFGLYFTVPAGRFDAVESLPGIGKLVGMAGTARGPVALLIPAQHAGAAVRAGEGSTAAEPTLEQPKLLHLKNDKWGEIPLPADFTPGRSTMLAAGGEDGSLLMILTTSPGDPHATRLFVGNMAGTWAVHDIVLDLKRVISLARCGPHVAVILDPDKSQASVEVAFLRNSGVVPLMTIPRPTGHWAISGLNDRLLVIARDAAGQLTARMIQPVSGVLDEAQPFVEQQLASSKIWHVSLAFAIVSAALVLVFLIKPVTKQPLVLPKDWVPASPLARVLALLVDLVPGGIIAVVILRCPPVELLRMPVMTIELDQSLPYMAMAGVALVHGTIGELWAGKSLGKMFIGSKVVASEGAKPSIGQILLRNVLKALVLLIPPLALFAILNNNMQGLGDIVARTAVVTPRDPEKPIEQAEDR